MQDLSYAAVFLICSIAGKDSLSWIVAGDPAQMISPGCSCTFDGMKQTLLSVRPGIEKTLSKVTQLLVNYRTTKDVLVLANKILAEAKRFFPLAIPFAREERAEKDLGLRILLCEWDLALKQEVELGTNQAIVFSTETADPIEQSVRQWVGDHPFVISSLESKGLEFDDVIVAFDLPRKIWNIEKCSQASLRMLRELYVAVTRAKRRVVVLYRRHPHLMQQFFEDLDCDYQTEGVELVLKEFQKAASVDDWRDRAHELYADEQYEMASHCFRLANNDAWSCLSQAKHYESVGRLEEAVKQYFCAIALFAARSDHEFLLKISLELVKAQMSQFVVWNEEHSNCIDVAMECRPDYLRPQDGITLAVSRDSWESITTGSLQRNSCIHLHSVSW